jgi:hypothetical protein
MEVPFGPHLVNFHRFPWPRMLMLMLMLMLMFQVARSFGPPVPFGPHLFNPLRPGPVPAMWPISHERLS